MPSCRSFASTDLEMRSGKGPNSRGLLSISVIRRCVGISSVAYFDKVSMMTQFRSELDSGRAAADDYQMQVGAGRNRHEDPAAQPVTEEQRLPDVIDEVTVLNDAGCSKIVRAAAAPPSAASNSRRLMVTVIRPSRARCVKGRIPRHERVVLTFKEGTMLVASTSVVGFNCTTSAPSPSRTPPSGPRASACRRASACDPREAECDQVVVTHDHPARVRLLLRW